MAQPRQSAFCVPQCRLGAEVRSGNEIYRRISDGRPKETNQETRGYMGAPFKRAIALAPQNPMNLKLGLTYLKLGDKSSALEQYQLLKERNSILAQQLLNRINDAQ